MIKKRIRPFFAFLLIFCLLFTAVGCSGNDNSWAAKKGDTTIPIGVYLYFLSSACNEAADLVEDPSKDVLKQTIEDLPAETWIRNRAVFHLNYYLTALQLAQERELSLTAEEKASALSASTTSFNQYKDLMDEYGISLSSYSAAYMEQTLLLDKLFFSIYGEDGEQAISDKDLEAYFEDSYTYYKYITKTLYNYVNGTYTVMTEEEMAEAKKEFDDYLAEFNAGTMTMDDIVDAYEATPSYQMFKTEDAKSALSESVTNFSDTDKIGIALSSIKPGQAAVVDYSSAYSSYFLVFKMDIRDKTEEWMDSNRDTILADFKSEDFKQFIEDNFSNLTDVTLNESALNSIKLSKFFN